MTNLMVKVFNCTQMEANIKENSDLERKKVEESLYGEMGLFIMDSSKMDSCRDKEFIIYQMAKLIKGSSGRTKDTAEEHTLHPWEHILEATNEIKKKERVSSLGLMVKYLKELSIMENLMGKARY